MWEQTELRMYGQEATTPPLDWESVEAQLEAAGTYWTNARTRGYPHPRPVWGVWIKDRLYLSIGSSEILQALALDPVATVHLDSGTDVVIIQGRFESASTDPKVISQYDAKYDWHYDLDDYGPLQCLEPVAVLAWRSAGWAGREGFRQTGRWRYVEDRVVPPTV